MEVSGYIYYPELRIYVEVTGYLYYPEISPQRKSAGVAV